MMRTLLYQAALIALVWANTEKIIFHGSKEIESAHDPHTYHHVNSWAERKAWPALQAPYASHPDSIRPRSALDDGHNPINAEDPHYEYQNEIPFQRWYRLQGIQSGGGYEARISYPATSPTDFKIMLLNYTQVYSILNDPILHGSSNSAEFQDFLESDNDMDLKVLHDMKYTLYLFVEGNYTGVSTVEGVEFRPVKYNLALEQLHLGFIPNQAYKLAISLLIVVGLGVFFVVPGFWRHIMTTISEDASAERKKRT